MVKFEYKVVAVGGVKDYVFEGHVSESKIENVINHFANEGWEYQNAISNQYVTDGEEFLKPVHYLVFRRPKT